ncbi:MAG: zinc transporter, family [Miltoncostaeaceae bacterium]|nr:zinc transporter, family [Miltoncostaeaceae bacterium]
MTFEKTLALGAIAGFTIFLGLPLARMRGAGARVRLASTMLATGILAFLFMEIAGKAGEQVEETMLAAHQGAGSWARFVGLAIMLAVGFVVGLVSLGWFEGRWLRRTPPMAGGSEAASISAVSLPAIRAAVDPMRMGLLIAAAIGLHNFSEGLAIGVAAQTGAVSLATVLIVGFALHNATEGFGIVGALDAEARPSWGWLGLAGLIGGGPTVIGTAIGWRVDSQPLALAFLALAAGAILYVVLELWRGARRRANPVLATSALAGGFLIAFFSELVIAYAGF